MNINKTSQRLQIKFLTITLIYNLTRKPKGPANLQHRTTELVWRWNYELHTDGWQ